MKIDVGKGTPVSAPITPGMDDANPWATHVNRFGRGGIKLVGSKAGLKLIPLERRYESIALVRSGDDGLEEAYMWTGVKEDGTDGTWEKFNFPGLLVVADTQGAIPKGRHTLVFGEDFEIQEAGDQGAGVLIQLSDLAKQGDGKAGSGLVSVGTFGKPSTFSKGNVLEFEPPFEAYADPDTAGTVRITMQHGLFEPAKAPGYLAYLNAGEEIIGNIAETKGRHKGRLWCGDVIVGAGPYIQIDKVNKALGLQEADDKDPNVSGGMNYLVAIVSAPKGVAPAAGHIRQYLYNTSAGSFAEDINGHPIATQVSYTDGSPLMPEGHPLFTAGILNEKGLQELTFIVEDNFGSTRIPLGSRTNGPTGIMVQALTPDSKTGDALQQFQLDTGISLPFRLEWMGADRSSIAWVVGGGMPMSWGAADMGEKMADGWDFHNLTVAKMGVADGHFVVQDTTAKEADWNVPGKGTEVCDFYFGKVFDSEETQMMRGHESEVSIELTDKKNAFNFSLVVWEGEPNKQGRVFDKRDNGSIVLNDGWRIVDTLFVPESLATVDHAASKKVEVPVGANNFGWIVYPAEAQSPVSLKLKKMDVNVPEPFQGAILRKPVYQGEKGLEYSHEHQTFVQDTHGNAALRYTINSTPASGLPMPVGVSKSGLAGFVVDDTVNVITGSSAGNGEGAYVFPADGKAIFNLSYNVYPGEKLAKGKEATVRFWASVVGADGNTFVKIPASETTHIVIGGELPFVMRLNPFSYEGEKGDRIALFALTDSADDAYVQCVSDDKPLLETKINFTELVPVS